MMDKENKEGLSSIKGKLKKVYKGLHFLKSVNLFGMLKVDKSEEFSKWIPLGKKVFGQVVVTHYQKIKMSLIIGYQVLAGYHEFCTFHVTANPLKESSNFFIWPKTARNGQL